MGHEIDLKKGVFQKHLNRAEKAIRDGYIIIIPLEHSYAFACDAFREQTVREMHVLRGDALGVVAQVLVANTKTAQGIIRDITPDISALMKKFWPGMLSMNLRPQLGLSWDLGDNRELDQVSIRVPKSKFAKALLLQTGPLAITSAALVGRPPVRQVSDISVLESATAATFNSGKLRAGSPTTVVEADDLAIRMVRAGAITLAQLKEVAPDAMRTVFGSLYKS